MTLNQTIDKIRELAISHEQINSFGFGVIGDFLDNEVVYPACFMELPSEVISGNGSLERRQNFALYFFDRCIMGGDNTSDVLSDMQQVALDIFAQLRFQHFDFSVIKESNIEYFIEREADYTAGVKLNVSLKYPLVTDRCAVPSNYNF